MLHLHSYRNVIGLFLFSALLNYEQAFSQGPASLPPDYHSSAPVNYVRIWDVVKPVTGANELTLTTDLQTAKITNQYMDGLGRSIQTVVKKGSFETATGITADLVSTVVYDEYGRVRLQYIPSPANNAGGNTHVNDGLFKLNAFQQQQSFYNSYLAAQTGEVATNKNWAYSKTNFEASPLNRVEESFAPGVSWVGSEDLLVPQNNKSVKMKYWVNTAADDVRIWNVTGSTPASFGSYVSASGGDPTFYAAGQLYKNVTEDEHGKQVIEFKDKEGKVILK